MNISQGGMLGRVPTPIEVGRKCSIGFEDSSGPAMVFGKVLRTEELGNDYLVAVQFE